MSKHTPGPWIVVEHPQGGSPYGIGVEGSCFAGCHATAYYPNSAANARLIAAAPKLLEALMDCVAGHIDDYEVREKALAAIAKATGEAA